ncbi:MAG TPA: hypothetical protein VIX19_21945 [Terriglobales bacterium]
MFLVFVICPPKRATWINAACRLLAIGRSVQIVVNGVTTTEMIQEFSVADRNLRNLRVDVSRWQLFCDEHGRFRPNYTGYNRGMNKTKERLTRWVQHCFLSARAATKCRGFEKPLTPFYHLIEDEKQIGLWLDQGISTPLSTNKSLELEFHERLDEGASNLFEYFFQGGVAFRLKPWFTIIPIYRYQ